MNITLPEYYQYVILTSVCIGIQCTLSSIYPVRVRERVFNEKFMSQFKVQHFQEIKDDLPKNGYPDMGNGIYSQKLQYKDWFEFNNAQRIHHNFLEQITAIILNLLVSGLSFPLLTTICGILYFFGRLFYGYGYYNGGPNQRLKGGIVSNLTAMFLMLSSLVSILLIVFK